VEPVDLLTVDDGSLAVATVGAEPRMGFVSKFAQVLLDDALTVRRWARQPPAAREQRQPAVFRRSPQPS